MAARRASRCREADIQPWLDRRRPGQSRFTTQRQEPDQVRILSGVFEGMTTGTPIALQIDNVDQRSRDYGEIADQFRPGHADLTYELKYGIRDYRGGGRSSARETAMRVAAGAVARQGPGRGRADPRRAGADGAAPDRPRALGLGRGRATTRSSAPTRWRRRRGRSYLLAVRKAGSSLGAVIEVVAEGVPPGLGAPIYGKLDADLAQALMCDQRGEGRGDRRRASPPPRCRGEDNADEMRMADGVVAFAANHAGGILGGISTGQPIVARFAVKPTSSILTPRPTVDRLRAGDRDRDQGPARSLRRHPRGAGGRGDDGLRAGRPSAAPPRAEPGRAGGGAAAAELRPLAR